MEVLSSFHAALLWGQQFCTDLLGAPARLQGLAAQLAPPQPHALLPQRTAVASRCLGSCCLPPWGGLDPDCGPQAQASDALFGNDASLLFLRRTSPEVTRQSTVKLCSKKENIISLSARVVLHLSFTWFQGDLSVM